MKVLGHPIHTILVHFPVALLPTHFVFAILFFCTGNTSFGPASFYTLLGGVMAGWLAAFMGLLDYFTIDERNKTAHSKALVHAGINIVVLVGFSYLAYWVWKVNGMQTSEPIGVLVLSGILVLLLAVGGYFGGSLVYVEHIGIDNKKTDE